MLSPAFPTLPASETLRIVSYWRASLADGARQDVKRDALKPYLGADDGPYAVPRELLRDGVVPDAARVQQIFRDGRRGNEEDGRAGSGTCPVLVCPLVARGAVVQGRRLSTEDFVVPLYIPAELAADGTLSPPREGAPWIPRDRLEPGKDTLPVLVGRVAAVDQFLSTNDPPDAAAGWRAYWDHAWRMLAAVADDAGWRLSEDGFDPGELGLAVKGTYVPTRNGFVVPHVPSHVMVAPLLATYEHLLGQKEPPALLARVAALEPREQEAPMEALARLDAHTLHLGQMSDRHPLAPSQREALHHALTLADGDVLAINGPPGTGKTTLLQSVVASLWVRAALEEGEPPVIVAVSTNNQAVTNVIESFGKAQQEASPLAGRWLPGVASYGLFCAAQSKRDAGAERFQVASERGEGFPAQVENADYVASASAAYLERAGEAFGRKFKSVGDVVAHLHVQLAGCRGTLREGVHAARKLTAANAEAELLFDTVDLDPLAEAARTEAATLEQGLRARVAWTEELVADLRRRRDGDAADVQSRADERAARWKGLREGWEAFERSTPAWIVLLSWLPPVREHRRKLIRRFLQSADASPPPEVRDPPEVDAWIGQRLPEVAAEAEAALAALDAALKTAVDDEYAELESFAGPREAHLAQVEARLSMLEAVMDRIRVAGAAWRRWVAEREAEAAAFPEPVRPRPTVDDALEVADRLTRVRAFQLATHYWEGRWLEEMREQIESGYRPGQTLEKQEKRWRRYAKLTPCMVSTLFKAPSFFSYWAGENVGARPLLSLIDLLIIDEAGQVSPELAGAAFALARRALVVGDTEQLQPVPRVSGWGDIGNLRHAGLAAGVTAADRVQEAGITAATGSAMRVAQRRSPRRIPGLPYGGMLLTEHYRCAPPIIAYCNELCYGGRLVPVRPADAEPPDLPRMGYVHVPGTSRRTGTSRANELEAWTVAQWIAGHADALRRLGARARGLDEREPPPLEQVVAVVTPFKAQARVIGKALEVRGIRGLTVDTVHSLQGDERDVVVFSSVYAQADGGSRYMLENRSLLNVAVSRARESFLVFGDMGVFDPRGSSPAGLLARHLFRSRDNELLDVEVRPTADLGPVRKLAGLGEHREALRDFFAGATEAIRITSPWVGAGAIREEGLERLIADAVTRGVQVTCYIDAELNQEGGQDRPSAAEGKQLLAASGATVKVVRRIHNKTVTVDDRLICEGSFNWLSAARREESPFHRYERSLVYADGAAPLIQRFLADIESRVVRTVRPGEVPARQRA
ncbi:AAA domain-containing protein [Longimicrobium sp.]|uniref:AAA domain-containing protein n=1 Tax=Longimicrobium sp. TaxID=2029185 RepID=UPI002ED84635